MGWGGYTNYSGDGTQTQHYSYLEWAKVATENEIMDGDWLGYRKTKIPNDKIPIFIKNIDLVLKKMPSHKFWSEYDAIDWQMLLSLFLDNKIKECPKIVIEKGIEASEYLLGEHSDGFDEPSKRRKHIKNFITNAKNFYSNDEIKNKKDRVFFFHYNKIASKKENKPKLTLHYKNTCHLVDHILLKVETVHIQNIF
jgi:hypothetical protein